MTSAEATSPEHPWGRVADDGTVYLRTSDGERAIGQWPGGDPQEALALYAKRFDGLEIEVELLEKRVAGGTLGPDDAARAIATVRDQVDGAHALGDLDSLANRLDALSPAVDQLREQRKAAKEARIAEALATKTRIVETAEKIAASTDWRNGADRLRELLDEWKALSRLDRATDDALWHRFSTARTSFTRLRKTHFADVNAQRESAKSIKDKLIAEAEALSSSVEWGPTTLKYRDLMQRWKAAGSAPRNVEDALWKKFRAAQDVFFSARDAANAAEDEEFRANATVKEAILAEAEKLLPITDLDAARRAMAGLSERWEAAGKVPRDRIKDLEGRLRAVESAIRSAGDKEWKRTDPEKSARADDLVAKLEKAIADLEAELAAAQESGDKKRIKEAEENLASRRAFLDMAQKAAADFG
jgi:vacuolar-type H+-ATPase subunit I/STV1